MKKIKHFSLPLVFLFSIFIALGYYLILLAVFKIPYGTSFYSFLVEFVKIAGGTFMFILSFRINHRFDKKVKKWLMLSAMFFALSGFYRIASLLYFNFVFEFHPLFFLAQNVFLGISAFYLIFDTLGEKGRSVYLFNQIPVDMIYPGLFAISYSLLLFYLFKKSFKPNSKIYALSLVPLFGGLFDYLENIGIIVMISIYPQFSSNISNITNTFSILKSIFTTLFFTLLIIGIVALVVKKRRKN